MPKSDYVAHVHNDIAKLPNPRKTFKDEAESILILAIVIFFKSSKIL